MIKQIGYFSMAIAVLLLAYMTSLPLPDNMPEPWKTRLFMASTRFPYFMGDIGHRLGIDTDINMTRKSFEMLTLFLEKPDYTGLKVRDTVFDGVSVRVYEPEGASGPLPAVVFYHGGAWMYLDVGFYDALTAELARTLQAVVVSVEYTRAPESGYLGPLDDCVKATKHFLSNAGHYDVDTTRVAVAGDSAGGQIAAATALRLRDEKFSPKVKVQLLIYPLLQFFDLMLPSYLENEHKIYGSRHGVAKVFLEILGLPEENLKDIPHFISNNHTTAAMKRKYADVVSWKALPKKYQPKDYPVIDTNHGNPEIAEKYSKYYLDPYLCPLMHDDVTGLPPAYIMVAGHDTLRDDGILYGRKLEKSGVAVTLKHYKDAFHGTLTLSEGLVSFDVSKKIVADIVKFLKKNL